MKNNKQTDISVIKRKNRFFSNFRCIMQIERLSKKSILTAFEQQELTYFNNRLSQINIESYMEEKPC